MDWLSGLSGLSIGSLEPVDVSAPARSRLASLFQAPVEEAVVADDEPMGFESEIQTFFELKEWPSARLLPSQPVWVQQALASVAPKPAAFLSPPPGFETQTSIDESNAIRGALTLIMQNARVPIQEKMAQISHGLIWAAATANLVVLAAILSCRTDPNSNTSTPLEASPIHFAAFCGHAALVDMLIKSGAQVNAQDSRGRTALDWAVVGNQVDMVRRLARDGAMLGAGMTDGRCGLDYAAAIGNTKAVAELIAVGVPLDRSDTAGRTSLHWASVLGRTSIVRMLLHAGANPDATSRDQSTPLHWAVAAGHGFCVAELLTGGANPGLLDRRGQRPLDMAASLGKRDLVEMLVDGGAPALESALLCACRAGRGSNAGHVETIKSLIRLGVDVYCKDEQGRSAIEIVKASGGLPEIIAVLSGNKANSARLNISSSNSVVSTSSSSGGGNINSAAASNASNNSQGSAVGAGAVPAPAAKSEEREKRFKKNKKKEKNAGPSAAAGGGGEEDEGEFSNVVHIGSLPSIAGGTLWEAIKTTMSQFGTVRQVRMTPKSTFAFVEFESVEEAVAAVNKCQGSVTVHGSPCTVSWATRRKRKGRKPKQGSSEGGGGEAAVAMAAAAPGKDSASQGQVAKPKKKNLCNLFVETGACSWGANCKYSHDTSKRSNNNNNSGNSNVATPK